MRLGSRQVAAFDDPGRTFADLPCHQCTGADHSKDRHGAGLQDLSRLIERQLASLLALTLSEYGDVMASPEGSHARLGPCMPFACAMTQSIEQRGDAAVGHQPSQFGQHLFDFDRGLPAVGARSVLDDAELGMVTALPVHLQLELYVRDLNDDLLDDCPQDSFARLIARIWVIPCTRQIGSQIDQGLPPLRCHLRYKLSVQPIKVGL